MSPVMVGVIAITLLFILLFLGLPVGLAMAFIGAVGLLYFLPQSAAIAKIGIVPFETVSSYDISVLPLFLLMAEVIFASGIGNDLYNLALKWLGRLPGGLAMASVGACAGFSAVSSSSIATAATMGLVAIPEMKKYNYHPALATGCVAAGGTLGILIPPSGVLIMYGIYTQTSISKLFIAGIVPGILEAILFIAAIYILCIVKPSLGPKGPTSSFREKILAFGKCGEIAVLVILVLGGLMIGWFTPTESGAVGAFGAIAISLARKRLSWAKFKSAVFGTAKTTGMIYFVLIGALLLNYFLALTTLPNRLSEIVTGLQISSAFIILVILLIYMILGCIMDTAAMILFTMPIFLPMVIALNYNLVWFGKLIVMVNEIGMITPPIGMNVFVIHGIVPDIPMYTVFKGITPFFVVALVLVLFMAFVPEFVMVLPNLVK